MPDKKDKILAVFFFFLLMLNFPILALANRDATLAGMPMLYLYIFIVWAIFIGVLFFIINKK